MVLVVNETILISIHCIKRKQNKVKLTLRNKHLKIEKYKNIINKAFFLLVTKSQFICSGYKTHNLFY